MTNNNTLFSRIYAIKIDEIPPSQQNENCFLSSHLLHPKKPNLIQQERQLEHNLMVIGFLAPPTLTDP